MSDHHHAESSEMADVSSMDDIFLSRLRKIIDENISHKDFGVDELCREIAMSRSQVHRKLQEITGQSTSRFIRSYKLEKAREKLERRMGRVSEISDQLGFSSPAYFTQVFTEEFGYAPSEVPEQKDKGIGQIKPLSSKGWLFLGLGIVILIVVYLFRPPLPSEPPVEYMDQSIVVLPFENMSADPENEYFSDGMTEDVIGQLAKISDLKVISRTSSMLYKNSDKNIKEIAAELGVRTVLEGSVRKDGNKVRIAAQLISAETDVHLWSEIYERELSDLFQVQFEIARDISLNLAINISDIDLAKLAKRSTSDLTAYDYYQKGLYYYRGKRRSDIDNSIDMHRKAIAMDSSFSLPYVGLVESYITAMSTYGYPKIWWDSINAFAEKALALDDQSAEVHYALGRVRYEGRMMEHFERALQINPNFDLVYFYISILQYGKQDLVSAVKTVQNALDIDPFNPRYLALLSGYLYLLELDELAIETALTGLDYSPDFIELHAILSLIHRTIGDFDKAQEYARNMLEIDPRSLKGFNLQGDAYLFDGVYDQARKSYQTALQIYNAKYSGVEAYRSNLLSLAFCMWESDQQTADSILNVELSNLLRRKEPYSHFRTPYEIAAIHSITGNKKEALIWIGKTLRSDIRIHRGFTHDPYFQDIVSTNEFEVILDSAKNNINRMRDVVRKELDGASR